MISKMIKPVVGGFRLFIWCRIVLCHNKKLVSFWTIFEVVLFVLFAIFNHTRQIVFGQAQYYLDLKNFFSSIVLFPIIVIVIKHFGKFVLIKFL